MDIEARQVVPVVGPELLTIDQQGTTLYRRLATDLVTRLGIDETRLPPKYDLLDATSLYLQNAANCIDDLHYETRDILTRNSWQTPEPLQKLAAITHLDLFISTTFDS